MINAKEDKEVVMATNKLLERILWLTREGFRVEFKPDIIHDGWVEFRLSKDNNTVAQTVDLDISKLSYAWKSDEEWFLYNLFCLECQYEKYVRKLKENDK